MIELARIIGPGRAGRSIAGALRERGVEVDLLDRRASVVGAARGCDLLLIATPDPVVAEVAARVEPVGGTVVAHVAGSLGLDVLDRHPRRASLHPLVAMPDPATGAARLAGAWFAVAGDPLVGEVVELLDGHLVAVDDGQRVVYHAAAVVASNHLVALLGQVERIAEAAGVPFEAFLDLVRSSVDNVAESGPAHALTGPVARGDWATVVRHLDALPWDERPAYDVMANEARKLISPRSRHRDDPDGDAGDAPDGQGGAP